MGMKESMETSRSIEVVGIGIPYYDMVINVNKMPGLDGAASANEAFYQGGGKVATAMRRWHGWEEEPVSSPRWGKTTGEDLSLRISGTTVWILRL